MADEKKKQDKKPEKKENKKAKSAKVTKIEDKQQKVDLPQFSSKSVLIEPITTEKIIRQIELENKIAFMVNRKASKEEIKKEVEETFKTKVESINTQVRNNKKIAFIKLKADSPAIDIATKLGLM